MSFSAEFLSSQAALSQSQCTLFGGLVFVSLFSFLGKNFELAFTELPELTDQLASLMSCLYGNPTLHCVEVGRAH